MLPDLATTVRDQAGEGAPHPLNQRLASISPISPDGFKMNSTGRWRRDDARSVLESGQQHDWRDARCRRWWGQLMEHWLGGVQPRRNIACDTGRNGELAVREWSLMRACKKRELKSKG
ncbi:MAG: hypothetical protein ACHP84_01100 [Caulobacterales bacterium]